MEDVLNKFEEHCNPRQNVIYERYKFQCRHQETGESGSHFPTELRIAADSCDFGRITMSQIIRDRFVHGLRDAKVRERLLRENDLTLDRASEMVQAAEVTADQMHVMSGEQTVSAVETQYGRGQGRKGHQGHKQFRHPVKKPQEGDCKPGAQCKYCPYEHAPKSCPAYGKQCR